MLETLSRPRILDVGSWPEGKNPWDGADVEVIAVPEETFLFRKPGWRNLYETAYPGCTSLYEPDPVVIDRFSQISTDYNFRVTGERSVQTQTLDSLEIQADMIKLDIQGSEPSVLHGGKKTLSDAVVVQIEVEFLPLYKDQPTAGEVFAFMEEQGFYLHQLRDCGGSPFKPYRGEKPYLPASQLLYADAVFIRDITALVDDQRLRLISVLWNILKSHDLAVHLMAETDPVSANEMISLTPSTTPTFITLKADQV